ncbi:HAMP domain-containing histidine kinase [bacterium]|nr:MAG: HAMP domain-containing histidine kinase [bacterium]
MELNSKTVGLLTHDLKGPIGNLSMFTEMLNSLLVQQKENGTSDLDQAIWYSSYIHMISSKYVDQLQNWSDFVNMLDKQLEFYNSSVQLTELVHEVLQSNQIISSKKLITVQVESAISYGVSADSDVLRRVLDNLIQLFVLLMPNSSTLTITIAENPNKQAECRITGLQSNDEKLFETLYTQKVMLDQAEVFGKGLIKTTGIGLAFCGEAIREMNGTPFISIDADTLTAGFTLPCAV